MVGPGLLRALGLLEDVDVGGQLLVQWSSMSETDLMEAESAAARLRVPGAKRFDESLPSTRWRAYGRVGDVCALLRQTGRDARVLREVHGTAAGS